MRLAQWDFFMFLVFCKFLKMYYFLFLRLAQWDWLRMKCTTLQYIHSLKVLCKNMSSISSSIPISNISSSVLQVKHVFNIQPMCSCSTGQTWPICNNSKPLGPVRKPQGDHRHPRSYQSWLGRGGQWTEGKFFSVFTYLNISFAGEQHVAHGVNLLSVWSSCVFIVHVLNGVSNWQKAMQ